VPAKLQPFYAAPAIFSPSTLLISIPRGSFPYIVGAAHDYLLSVCTVTIVYCVAFTTIALSLVMEKQGDLKRKAEDLGPWDKTTFEESLT